MSDLTTAMARVAGGGAKRAPAAGGAAARKQLLLRLTPETHKRLKVLGRGAGNDRASARIGGA